MESENINFYKYYWKLTQQERSSRTFLKQQKEIFKLKNDTMSNNTTPIATKGVIENLGKMSIKS